MDYIPGSPAEVKSVIEAVNLKTFTRFTYLKGEHGICKFPIGIVEQGVKSLEAALDEFVWDPEDPDQEIRFEDLDQLPVGSGMDGGGLLMYRERKPRRGEGNAAQLELLQRRAAAEVNTRRSPPVEKPQPATRRDNVVQLPASDKPAVRYRRPSHDVLKYFQEAPIGEEWKRMYYVMYKKSKYAPLCEVWGYAGKSKRKGRFYNQGNKELARSTGLSKYTVSRYLMGMKKNKIILQHKRGWPGEKCSIWELPFDLAHVFAWKRDPKRSS
jgi:hypothetical protein